MTKEADIFYEQKQFVKAAKLYEEAAQKSMDDAQKIISYRKAASSYKELGLVDDEVRCLIQTSEFLGDQEKIDCLINCWEAYITAIAVFQYETSYEWKGQDENLNDAYFETIDAYLVKAIGILESLIQLKYVDKQRVLERLANSCAKRQNEGGWGASHCWKSIDKAWKTHNL